MLGVNQRKKFIYTQSIINDCFQLQADDLLDSGDLNSSELETSMRLRLRDREVLFIRKIDEALRRITLGTYGECENCSEDIGLKRLRARPTTSLCVQCKEAQESEENRHHEGLRSGSNGFKLRLAAEIQIANRPKSL